MTPTQRAAYAYKILRSDTGYRAVSGNWHVFLWDFVFANERVPTPDEQVALAAEAAEYYAAVPNWPFAAARDAATTRFEQMRRAAYEHT